MKHQMHCKKIYSTSVHPWVSIAKQIEINHKLKLNSPNGDLYAYAANNPVRYLDPDGRSPVYNTDGNLIGVTEYTGLHGTPYFLDMTEDEFYEAKMSNDEVASKNLGMAGLKGENAVKNYIESYSNLKNRPDWDGKLTLDEANDWWRKGTGETLHVDMNSIDLSMLYSLGDDYVGKPYSFNLQTLGSKDGLVYGHLKFNRYPDDACRAYQDIYDFDMHPGIKSTPRNIATKIGSLYAGKGTPYKISFYGVQTLQKAWWVK